MKLKNKSEVLLIISKRYTDGSSPKSFLFCFGGVIFFSFATMHCHRHNVQNNVLFIQ